jgi:hypothetical protein
MKRMIPANPAKPKTDENGDAAVVPVEYRSKSGGRAKSELSALTTINEAPTPPSILFDSIVIRYNPQPKYTAFQGIRVLQAKT